MDCAHELLTLGEMKEISSIPSHQMVSPHVHKLVQVILLFRRPSSTFFKKKKNQLTLGDASCW